MTFNAHTDLWFDRLADYAARYERGATANVTDSLRSLTRKTANMRNLVALIEMIGHVRDAALQAHAHAVLTRQFKREFRFTFSCRRSHVSAASEFFSLIQQAVSYPA